MVTADRPSFTCPVCGATSYHPDDARYGYCGRCHQFTRNPLMLSCDDRVWNTQTGRCAGRVGHDGRDVSCSDCPARVAARRVELAREALNAVPWWRPLKRIAAAHVYKAALLDAALCEARARRGVS